MIHGPNPGAAQPKRAAGLGAEGGVPGQMGPEASELGSASPDAPVNLCPESVTSSCRGSLPGAKNSSFSFESFLVSESFGSPHPRRPTERKPGGALGREAGKAGSPVQLVLVSCAKEERAPPPDGGGGGRSERVRRVTP